MDYRDYIPRVLAPGWMSRAQGAAWLRASGDLKDSLAERCKAAVRSRFALQAPPDGVALIGGERSIERSPADTASTFAQRVAHAWRLWSWGGTARGLLTALRDAGYPGAFVEIVNGVQYSLSGAGELVRTQLPAGSWAVEATAAHWSAFVVLFPVNPFIPTIGPLSFTGTGDDVFSAPGGVPTGRYSVGIRCSVGGVVGAGAEVQVALDGSGDMSSWGPSTPLSAGTVSLDALGALSQATGLELDVDAGTLVEDDVWSFDAAAGPAPDSTELAELRRLVRRWKSAHAKCQEIVVITAGRTWGYPLRTWGGQGGTWSGNVVLRYP